MRRIKIIIFLAFMSSISNAQIDTLFWFAAPEVTNLHEDRPICIRLASMDELSTVTITQPANSFFASITVILQANSSQSIDLTPFIDIIENKPANSILNYGLKIQATTKITAYYEAGISINPEIFTLKGQNALGKEFYTPFQNFADNTAGLNAYCSFDIIATENNTAITITPSNSITGHPGNIPFKIILNRGQTYSCTAVSAAANNHLGGSHVVSDKPVAVTVKDDTVTGSFWGGCGDLLGDQIVPVNNLGTDYIVMKGFLNYNIEKVFILAVYDNTQIFVTDLSTAVATINTAQTYVVDIGQSSTFIKTSRPVYLLHMSGFGCELGAPLIPSIECTGSRQVSFTRSTNEFFGLNLMIKNGNQQNFSLNGNPALIPAASFSPVPGTNNEWVSAQLSFDISQIPVGSGNIMNNSTGVFHLGIINGGSISGCRYGYFSSFNRYNPVILPSYLCMPDTAHFRLSDNSMLNSVIWNFDDPSSGQNNTSTLSNPSHFFHIAGSYNVRIIYSYPCGVDTAYQQFTIGDKPVVNLGNDTSFYRNQALLDAGSNFVSYTWSTGAHTQTIKPTEPGEYFVTVSDKNSCTNSDTIHIILNDNISIAIPNFFSPNEDGINDTFGPVTSGIGSLEMIISDNTGRFIHRIDSLNGRWSGLMPSGKYAPQGVYFYVMNAIGLDKLKYLRKGSVTLLRDKASRDDISIVPNPVRSTAVVDVTGSLSGEKVVRIYSVSGLLLKTFNTSDDLIYLDMTSFSPGLYLIRAVNPFHRIELKLIKE